MIPEAKIDELLSSQNLEKIKNNKIELMKMAMNKDLLESFFCGINNPNDKIGWNIITANVHDDQFWEYIVITYPDIIMKWNYPIWRNATLTDSLQSISFWTEISKNEKILSTFDYNLWLCLADKFNYGSLKRRGVIMPIEIGNIFWGNIGKHHNLLKLWISVKDNNNVYTLIFDLLGRIRSPIFWQRILKNDELLKYWNEYDDTRINYPGKKNPNEYYSFWNNCIVNLHHCVTDYPSVVATYDTIAEYAPDYFFDNYKKIDNIITGWHLILSDLPPSKKFWKRVVKIPNIFLLWNKSISIYNRSVWHWIFAYIGGLYAFTSSLNTFWKSIYKHIDTAIMDEWINIVDDKGYTVWHVVMHTLYHKKFINFIILRYGHLFEKKSNNGKSIMDMFKKRYEHYI
jgi:hypothetical protein